MKADRRDDALSELFPSSIFCNRVHPIQLLQGSNSNIGARLAVTCNVLTGKLQTNQGQNLIMAEHQLNTANVSEDIIAALQKATELFMTNTIQGEFYRFPIQALLIRVQWPKNVLIMTTVRPSSRKTCYWRVNSDVFLPKIVRHANR